MLLVHLAARMAAALDSLFERYVDVEVVMRRSALWRRLASRAFCVNFVRSVCDGEFPGAAADAVLSLSCWFRTNAR